VRCILTQLPGSVRSELTKLLLCYFQHTYNSGVHIKYNPNNAIVKGNTNKSHYTVTQPPTSFQKTHNKERHIYAITKRNEPWNTGQILMVLQDAWVWWLHESNWDWVAIKHRIKHENIKCNVSENRRKMQMYKTTERGRVYFYRNII